VQEPERAIVGMLPIAHLLIPWTENDRNWSDARIASAANGARSTALGLRRERRTTPAKARKSGPVGEPDTRGKIAMLQAASR
jgi:hypothetical protein